MTQIVVSQATENEQTNWHFVLDAGRTGTVPFLCLFKVEISRRETPKRPFKVESRWVHGNSRDSTMPRPDIPKAIEVRALAKLVEQVEFK